MIARRIESQTRGNAQANPRKVAPISSKGQSHQSEISSSSFVRRSLTTMSDPAPAGTVYESAMSILSSDRPSLPALVAVELSAIIGPDG